MYIWIRLRFWIKSANNDWGEIANKLDLTFRSTGAYTNIIRFLYTTPIDLKYRYSPKKSISFYIHWKFNCFSLTYRSFGGMNACQWCTDPVPLIDPHMHPCNIGPQLLTNNVLSRQILHNKIFMPIGRLIDTKDWPSDAIRMWRLFAWVHQESRCHN